MRILSWNCRGLGKPSAVLQCQKKAQDHKPNILFLMETKLEEDKDFEVLKDVAFGMGGRFLVWDSVEGC